MSQLEERMKADLRLRNLRPATQEQYVYCLRVFETFQGCDVEQVGQEDVRTFLLHLVDEKGLKPATVKVYMAALKFVYATTLGRPEVVESLCWPKVPRTLPEILSGSEVEALLAAMYSVKYRALVTTAYGAGLRVGEACRLEVRDIDSKRMLIHVRDGKGGQDRSVGLPPKLLTLLREYWRLVRPAGPYLFPGRRPDMPLSRMSVLNVVKKVAVQCGLTKRVTPHSLRHAFATHLLESGADIRVIQVVLGHRSIQTTERYAQVSARHIARVESPLQLLGTKRGKKLLG